MIEEKTFRISPYPLKSGLYIANSPCPGENWGTLIKKALIV